VQSRCGTELSATGSEAFEVSKANMHLSFGILFRHCFSHSFIIPLTEDPRQSRVFQSMFIINLLHWIFVLLSITVTHSLFIFYYSSTCFGLTWPSSGVIVYSPEAECVTSTDKRTNIQCKTNVTGC
jgi:hypothetical protein